MRCTRCSLPAFGLLGLFSSFAQATPVLVTNPGDAQWGSAISGLTATPIDFSGLTNFETTYLGPNWPVISGATFQAGGNAPTLRAKLISFGPPSGTVLIGPPVVSWSSGYLEILLPNGVSAVSFRTGPDGTKAGPIDILINDTGSLQVVTSGSFPWVGVVLSSGITDIKLSTPLNAEANPWLGSLTYYTGSEPPPPPPPPPSAEAETWILAVTGLVLMVIGAKSHDWGWGARRRAH